MKERMLMKISATGAAISILALYLITFQIYSSHVNIGEIDKSFIGKTVNVTGNVERLSNSKGNIFMNVNDGTGKIKVVLWEDVVKSMSDMDINELKDGMKINVIGDVQVYMGEIEIIPIRNSVKIVS